jgi:hypothetical protein
LSEQGSVYRFETETPSRVDGNMSINCSTERRLAGIDRAAEVPVTLNGEAPLKRLSDQLSDVTQEAWGLKLIPGRSAATKRLPAAGSAEQLGR